MGLSLAGISARLWQISAEGPAVRCRTPPSTKHLLGSQGLGHAGPSSRSSFPAPSRLHTSTQAVTLPSHSSCMVPAIPALRSPSPSHPFRLRCVELPRVQLRGPLPPLLLPVTVPVPGGGLLTKGSLVGHPVETRIGSVDRKPLQAESLVSEGPSSRQQPHLLRLLHPPLSRPAWGSHRISLLLNPFLLDAFMPSSFMALPFDLEEENTPFL